MKMQVFQSPQEFPKDIELFLANNKDKKNIFNSDRWMNIVRNNPYLSRIYIFTEMDVVQFVFYVGINQIKNKKFAFINNRKFGGVLFLNHDAISTAKAFDMLCSDLKKQNVNSLSITSNSYDGNYHLIGSIVNKLDTQKFNCDLILDLSDGLDVVISRMSKKRKSNIKASLKKDYFVETLNSSSLEDIKIMYDKFVAKKSGMKVNKKYLNALLSSDITKTLSISNKVGVILGFVVFIFDEDNKEAFYFMSAVNRNEKSEYVIERIIYKFINDYSGSIKKLNFMESTPSYESGVYNFKSQWGAESFPNITVEKYFGTLWLKNFLISLYVKFIK